MINIDDLVGVRYVHGGRSIEEGFDCYGLAIEVEKRLGHILPDLEETREINYDFTLCESLCLGLVENVKLVDRPTKEGDILLFKDSNGVMFHIGVYLGNRKFIHCNKFGVHLTEIGRGYNIGAVYSWQ